MGLDTKYRPVRYEDVLGQESTITILKRFVATGKAWEQSYLFAGPFGSGKTTLARIMARAMLCDAPVDGSPCDKCPSCTTLLGSSPSFDFVEVDAATNSGKEAIQQIVEELQYATFSGKRKLYLFDESHRLSSHALDALLKPMEEGKLICLFATTEPESMAETVFSRCAPAFVVQTVTPEKIAERLAWVCQQEGIEVTDSGLLVTIAEMKECHIRDCLKAIEGLSMLGPINRENVVAYLHLDQNAGYLDILESLGRDFPKMMEVARQVLVKSSPVTVYENLAETAMLAFQVANGFAKSPSHMDGERLRALGQQHGAALLGIAHRLSSRPGHPSDSMLLCDLGILHYAGGFVPSESVVMVSATPAAMAPTGTSSTSAPVANPTPAVVTPPATPGMVKTGMGSAEVKPLPGAVNDGRPRGNSPMLQQGFSEDMSLAEFARLLGQALREEMRGVGGST